MEGMVLTYHMGTDGMQYPNLKMPEEETSIAALGRFAVRAMEYLKENHKSRYRMLARFRMLAEKMEEVQEEADRMMEILEKKYLENNPLQNSDSTMEMWNLREQARRLAEEIVMAGIVMKYH